MTQLLIHVNLVHKILLMTNKKDFALMIAKKDRILIGKQDFVRVFALILLYM